MVEGFGLDALASISLEGVISDGFGRAHCFFDVAFFEKVCAMSLAVLLVGMVSPNASVEIGLEFKSDGKAVVLDVGDPAFLLVDVGGFTGEFLDMVADFMSDDVGVGEVTTTTEVAIHLAEE